MRFSLTLIAAVCCLSSFCLFPAVVAGQSNGIEMLKLAVRAREAINSGELTFVIKTTRDGAQQTRDVKLAFSGNDLSYETCFRDAGASQSIAGESTECLSVVATNEFIAKFRAFPGQEDDALAPTIYAGDQRERGEMFLVEARHFGLLSGSIMDGRMGRVEKLLETLNTVTGSASVVELDGKQVNYWQGTRESGSIVRIWIDPEFDNNVVQFEVQSERNGKALLSKMRAEYALVPEANIWFPKRIVNSKQSGEAEPSLEEVEFLEVRLNSPARDLTLTLADLKLPPGTAVLDQPAHISGDRIWNGTELVPMVVRPTITGEPIKSNSGAWLAVAISCGTLALILACLIIWRWRREKTAGARQRTEGV